MLINLLTFKGEKPFELMLFTEDKRGFSVFSQPEDIKYKDTAYNVSWQILLEKYFDQIPFWVDDKDNWLIVQEIKINPITKLREIYSMADEFMYLVPANKAVQIAKRLQNLFHKNYQKVAGRLSLQLGIVYADHKYPLYLVLDAGKKMLQGFKMSTMEENYLTLPEGGKGRGIPATVLGVERKDNTDLYQIEFNDSVFTNEVLDISIDTILESESLDTSSEAFLESMCPDYYYQSFIYIDELGKAGITPGNSKRIQNRLDYIQKRLDKEDKFKKPDEDLEKGIETETYHFIHELKNLQILFVPNTIDFTYLNSNIDRMNLIFKKANTGKCEKRLQPICSKGLIRTRPYLWQRFVHLIEFNQKLTNARISSSALHNLQALYLSGLERIFGLEEVTLKEIEKSDNELILDNLIKSILANVSNLQEKLKELHLMGQMIGYLKTGEFFDLMELRTFIGAFDE